MPNILRLKRIGVDFRNEHLVFMSRGCHICKSEGFEALNRIRVSKKDKTLVASLIVMDNPNISVLSLVKELRSGISG